MRTITLIVLGNGPISGREFRIERSQNMIGRESGVAIKLHDELISRRHAMVTRTGDRIAIEDLGSANGTWVNEQPVVGRRSLRPGDVVRIGGLDVLVADDGRQMTRLMETLPAQAARYDSAHTVDPTAGTRRTASTRTELAPDGSAPRRSTFALSARGLTLNAIGSGVTALTLSAFRVPEVGAILGPALAAVVTAFIQTSGRTQWLRIMAAAGAAYLIAAAGITIPEIAIGRSLADGDSPSTYLPDQVAPDPPPPKDTTSAHSPTSTVPTRTSPTTESAPGIEARPTVVDCGEAIVGESISCPEITIRSNGNAPLMVTSVDLDAIGGFTANAGNCLGRQLVTDEECVILIEFTPVREGEPAAQIVIHQNIPLPDQGTLVELTGVGVKPPGVG